MATCNPNELAKDASCFFCLPPGYYYPVKLAILARILKALDPGADTSPAGLMADAAAACIACPPQGELGPMRLALICDATGGGGAVPIPPSNLTIDLTSTSGDEIPTWTNNGGATNIEVWKSVNGGAYALYATIAGAATNYHDPAIMNGGDYWEYQVRAVGSGGPSAFSNKAGISDFFSDVVSVNISMPFLVLALNGISAAGSAPLLTVSFPELLKIADTKCDLAGCINLTSVSMPKLQSVSGDIDCTSDTSLVTIDFSSLVTVGGNLLFPFTNVSANFPDLTSVGNIDFSASGGATFSAQALVTAGTIDFNSCPNLGSALFGQLTSANGLNFTNCANLSSVSFTLLASVTGNIDFSLCPTLLGLQFPALTMVAGFFNGSETPSLGTLSLPVLATVGGNLIFTQTAGDSLTAISLPALTTVGGDFHFDNNGPSTFNANALTTVSGDFFVTNLNGLTTLSCSALTTASGLLSFQGNTSLTSINFNNLQTIGGELNSIGNTALVTISFPALTSVPADLYFQNCTALVNISFPVAIFADNTDDIDFTNDAVAAGVSGSGTGINGLLARGVASGVTQRDFLLSGGTNTGIAGLSAQGTTDYGILFGAGNNMVLNP